MIPTVRNNTYFGRFNLFFSSKVTCYCFENITNGKTGDKEKTSYQKRIYITSIIKVILKWQTKENEKKVNKNK